MCDGSPVESHAVEKNFKTKYRENTDANNFSDRNSNISSGTDSDDYIERYKEQANTNQTDCLGDDELSESEKRTKRTTKSLKSSRFKKRYNKKSLIPQVT